MKRRDKGEKTKGEMGEREGEKNKEERTKQREFKPDL